MTGLFLLLVIGIWIAFISWLVPKIIQKIPSKVVRGVVGTVLFLFFLVLPLIDEIIGGFQFRALCKEGAVMNVDEEKAINKIVISQRAKTTYPAGYFLPIRKQYWSYIDPDSKEVLVSWNEYRANGGIFIRTLGISETDSPLIFDGVCYPEQSGSEIFNKLNITKQDRN